MAPAYNGHRQLNPSAHGGKTLRPPQREEIRVAIREIVASIKTLDGDTGLSDDMPLFDYGAGEPSPLALDSLDMLDLALALMERFNLDEDRFDRILREDDALQALRTVNDIVEFVSSLSGDGGPTRSLESNAERR